MYKTTLPSDKSLDYSTAMVLIPIQPSLDINCGLPNAAAMTGALYTLLAGRGLEPFALPYRQKQVEVQPSSIDEKPRYMPMSRTNFVKFAALSILHENLGLWANIVNQAPVKSTHPSWA